MKFADFHVHTTYCDGNDSPEETIKYALSMGMPAIGFSGHSYLPIAWDWCMSTDGTIRYRKEIRELGKIYRGKIEVYLGIEQDADSEPAADGYDYIIGSVHYLHKDGRDIPVDHSRETFVQAVKDCYNGDYYAMCEDYFAAEARVCHLTHCDLIGHFDLVTKFNEGCELFDIRHPRYRAAWRRAADTLLRTGVPFEINTGAIYRGYRTTPYPDREIVLYLNERGASFVLSGDSHSARSLCFEFEQCADEAQREGIRLIDFRKIIREKQMNGGSKPNAQN